MLALAVLAAGCEGKANRANTEHGAQAQSARVSAAQVNMWYQTIAALKRQHYQSRLELDEALNAAIIENYLPLYLQQTREGQPNRFHLQTAKAAYHALSEEKRASLPLAKVVSEEKLQRIVGILKSFGYVEGDLVSAERFNALRGSYLDTIGAE
ncbi:MAG: hypothetical protein V4640_03070 [Verrucomicrobiota bacterium]